MKILIIGSGGREHALADAYSKSKNVTQVIVAPGNDFMCVINKKIVTRPQVSVMDFSAIVTLAKKEQPNLIDVAQDDPLAEGLVDILQSEGFTVFGPTKDAAEIEWNKSWSRKFMQKYHLPIPHFQSFSDQKNAIAYVQKLPEQPLFIKASGLAGGKGALKAENKKQAIDAIVAMQLFGAAGTTFLIEECMIGEEFSLFALCDGKDFKILGIAQDHKTINNKDEGANTGGMGCVTPINALTKEHITEVEKKIVRPFLKGMQKEGRPYTGILYVGGMLTRLSRKVKHVKVVEFNARWGDPEAEVILPSIITDYASLICSVMQGKLTNSKLATDKKVRVSITGAATGYPKDTTAVAGGKIFGLDTMQRLPNTIIYSAGMKKIGKHFVVNGGRLFHVVGEGKSLSEARKYAYAAMSQVYIEGNNLHYRTDIGWRDLERINKLDLKR